MFHINKESKKNFKVKTISLSALLSLEATVTHFFTCNDFPFFPHLKTMDLVVHCAGLRLICWIWGVSIFPFHLAKSTRASPPNNATIINAGASPKMAKR